MKALAAELPPKPEVVTLTGVPSAGDYKDVAFVPAWSIQANDTAIGEARVAVELVTKGILPRDHVHLHKNSSSSLFFVILYSFVVVSAYRLSC